MIRVGIVGLGGISKVHLDAYRELEGVKLVAAADLKGEQADRYDMAKELGARIYTSLEDMLAAEELDMLDVCTPTYLHKEMVKRGLEHGLHVISEKPMCRNSSECLELVELAKKSGKLFMVAHVVRFMKPYAYLRDLVKSGELGRPVHIFMRRLSSVPRWSYEDWMVGTELSGGTPLDLSIHDLDFVYSVFGSPREVSATYRQFGGKEGYAANDYITSELIYDGFSATVVGAEYDAKIPFTAEYLAVFENGWAELCSGKVYKCGEEVNLEQTAQKSASTGINISSSSAYTDEIAYFVDCIRSDSQPEAVMPESSMGSVALVERLLASAKII